MKKINVVLFGHGSLCILIAKYIMFSSRYKLDSIIISKEESIFDVSLKRWCLENKINHTQNINSLIKKKNDLGISVLYDQIISEKIIKKFKTIINCHYSLLPNFRGVNPVHWAFKLKKPIGVTLHKIGSRIDCGEVYLKKKITNKKTILENYLECSKQAFFLYKKFLKNYPKCTVQNTSNSKIYYSKEDAKKLGKYRYINQNKNLYKVYANYIFSNPKVLKSFLIIFNKNLPKEVLKIINKKNNVLVLSDKKISIKKEFVIIDQLNDFYLIYKKLILNKIYFNKIYIQSELLKKNNLSYFYKLLIKKNTKI